MEKLNQLNRSGNGKNGYNVLVETKLNAEQLETIKVSRQIFEERLSDELGALGGRVNKRFDEQGRSIEKLEEAIKQVNADNIREHKHTRELYDEKFVQVKESFARNDEVFAQINANLEQIKDKLAESDIKHAENATRLKILIWMFGGLLSSAMIGLALALLGLL